MDEMELSPHEKAIGLISAAFVDKKRVGNDPKFDHVIRVYEMVKELWPDDNVAQIAALLHDVPEDTDVTLTYLYQNFPKEVVDAVNLLTRRELEPYHLYIRNLFESSNIHALRVKLCDALDNSSLGIAVVASGELEFKTWIYWRIKYRKLAILLSRFMTAASTSDADMSIAGTALSAATWAWTTKIDTDAIKFIRNKTAPNRSLQHVVRNTVILAGDNPHQREKEWYINPWGVEEEVEMGAPCKNRKTASVNHLESLFNTVEKEIRQGKLKFNLPEGA